MGTVFVEPRIISSHEYRNLTKLFGIINGLRRK